MTERRPADRVQWPFVWRVTACCFGSAPTGRGCANSDFNHAVNSFAVPRVVCLYVSAGARFESVLPIRLYRKYGRGVLPFSGSVRDWLSMTPERVGRWATVRQSPRRLLAERKIRCISRTWIKFQRIY